MKRYTSDTATVIYEPKRCIHFAACVRGLPEVFDPKARPWIQPTKADADALTEVVMRCPTGALHIERHDGGEGEETPERNTVTVAPDGPLFFHGLVALKTSDGETVLEDSRVALCRCGASKHKPYCDGSHTSAGFADPAQPTEASQLKGDAGDGGVSVTLAPDGPLLIEGSIALVYAGEHVIQPDTGSKGAFCRCGLSANKPFCDGSHRAGGFKSDGI